MTIVNNTVYLKFAMKKLNVITVQKKRENGNYVQQYMLISLILVTHNVYIYHQVVHLKYVPLLIVNFTHKAEIHKLPVKV